jgi:hypothetical protein
MVYKVVKFLGPLREGGGVGREGGYFLKGVQLQSVIERFGVDAVHETK